MVVERESIRFLGLPEVAEAERPVVAIVLDGEAHGVAARISGVVRSAARHQRPVEKLGARVVREGVVVENIDERHLPDGHDQATRRHLPAELIGASLDRRLRPAQPDGLANEGPRAVQAGRGASRLLILAVAHAAKTVEGGQRHALDHLRVEEQLGASPEPVSQKKRCREGIARLVLRIETMRSIGNLRREARMHLPDVSCLEIRVPVFGSQCPRQPRRTFIDLDSRRWHRAGFRGRRLGPGRRYHKRHTREDGECDAAREGNAPACKHGPCV